MTRNLYLHVGAHKTGTTTIQYSLEASRQRLEEQGITYVSIYESCNNVPLRKFLLNILKPEGEWEQFFDNIKGDILISAEEISMYSQESLENIYNYFSNKGFYIHVHYFLREPVKWKQSDCKQMIRSGSATLKSDFSKGTVRRFKQIPITLDNVFGRENVQFHLFEEAVKDGIMEYFCEHCIALPGLSIPEKKVNESLSQEALILANLFTEKCPKGTGRSDFLSESINTLPGKKTNDLFSISEEEADQINSGLEYIRERNNNFIYNNVSKTDFDDSIIEEYDDSIFKEFIFHLNKKLLDLDSHIDSLKKVAESLEEEQRYTEAFSLYALAHKIRPYGPYIRNKKSLLRNLMESRTNE